MKKKKKQERNKETKSSDYQFMRQSFFSLILQEI